MGDLAAERQNRWRRIVEQLEREYRALGRSEQQRIAELLATIERLQQALDRLFRRAEGEQLCAVCAGACCARGHNHAVLPNLLAYLHQDRTPPEADFSRTCPWLGPQGCVHEAACRPYNCITFLCDKLEERLDAAEVAAFYRLDRELRSCYQAFAERYQGGGMTGLLLQSARLNGRRLLLLQATDNDGTARQEPA